MGLPQARFPIARDGFFPTPQADPTPRIELGGACDSVQLAIPLTNLDIDFSPDGSIDARITKGRLNGPGKSEEISFKSENATFDPISAAFLARNLPMNPGEDFGFDVFDGQDR